MPFSVSDLIYGGVIPLIAAAVAFLLVRRSFSTDVSQRYAMSIAGVVGFVIGYQLLGLAPSEFDEPPDRNSTRD